VNLHQPTTDMSPIAIADARLSHASGVSGVPVQKYGTDSCAIRNGSAFFR
jgi:hypothetical protein